MSPRHGDGQHQLQANGLNSSAHRPRRSPANGSAGASGGFLLSELTPIAVANFRTAPATNAGGRSRQTATATANNNVEDDDDAEDISPLHHGRLNPPAVGRSIDCPSQTSLPSPSPTPTDLGGIMMKRGPPSGGSIHSEDSDGKGRDKPPPPTTTCTD